MTERWPYFVGSRFPASSTTRTQSLCGPLAGWYKLPRTLFRELSDRLPGSLAGIVPLRLHLAARKPVQADAEGIAERRVCHDKTAVGHPGPPERDPPPRLDPPESPTGPDVACTRGALEQFAHQSHVEGALEIHGLLPGRGAAQPLERERFVVRGGHTFRVVELPHVVAAVAVPRGAGEHGPICRFPFRVRIDPPGRVAAVGVVLDVPPYRWWASRE